MKCKHYGFSSCAKNLFVKICCNGYLNSIQATTMNCIFCSCQCAYARRKRGTSCPQQKKLNLKLKACAVVCTYYVWLGNLPKRHYESLVFLFGITVKLFSSARVIRILIIGLSTANPLTSCSSTSTSNALLISQSLWPI